MSNNATAAAETAATADQVARLSFLTLLQGTVASVTAEDIARYAPTDPVGEGEEVLGTASPELQALWATVGQLRDGANQLADEFTEAQKDRESTVGQLKDMLQGIKDALVTHQSWRKLFWQMADIEFGTAPDDVLSIRDGYVIVKMPEQEHKVDLQKLGEFLFGLQ